MRRDLIAGFRGYVNRQDGMVFDLVDEAPWSAAQAHYSIQGEKDLVAVQEGAKVKIGKVTLVA